MQADIEIRLPLRLLSLATSATLLERLESQPRSASPEQYRSVVRQVTALLEKAAGDTALPVLLNARPATAELYENLHYASSGLCRAPLPQAVDAEVGAQSIIERARQV